METATSVGERAPGHHHSNDLAALERSEKLDAIAARITDCVVRAFQAIGASSVTQEIVFWNIHMTKNVGRSEIMDKPAEFMEGIRGIYGDAGSAIFESMLRREMRREFGLVEVFEEGAKERSTSDLLRLIRAAALESPSNP